MRTHPDEKLTAWDDSCKVKLKHTLISTFSWLWNKIIHFTECERENLVKTKELLLTLQFFLSLSSNGPQNVGAGRRWCTKSSFDPQTCFQRERSLLFESHGMSAIRPIIIPIVLFYGGLWVCQECWGRVRMDCEYFLRLNSRTKLKPD